MTKRGPVSHDTARGYGLSCLRTGLTEFFFLSFYSIRHNLDQRLASVQWTGSRSVCMSLARRGSQKHMLPMRARDSRHIMQTPVQRDSTRMPSNCQKLQA